MFSGSLTWKKLIPKSLENHYGRCSNSKDVLHHFSEFLQAIHDHSRSHVRVSGTQSTNFLPERGLREGCPSSPVLFNCYHHGILEVFRARRARAAALLGSPPGIPWVSKKMINSAKNETIQSRNTDILSNTCLEILSKQRNHPVLNIYYSLTG